MDGAGASGGSVTLGGGRETMGDVTCSGAEGGEVGGVEIGLTLPPG